MIRSFRCLLLTTAILAVAPDLALAQAAAGAVPSLSDQPSEAMPPQSTEPARAPGSAGEAGVTTKGSQADSGTTTTYAPATQEAVKWPCPQPRVNTISPGTIWSGPSLDLGKGWDDDNAVAELAQKVASRRTSIDEARGMIADFSKALGGDKDKKLTELFVGVLDIINGNRTELLDGIMRYARGQQRLAERMRSEADKISEAQSDAQGPTGIAVEERNKDFAWDQRIFRERRQALAYVCETPTLLEHRAFEIGRLIQAQL